MRQKRKGELLGLLKKLKLEGEIEGSAIVTRDGLLIVSDLYDGINEKIFAAMAAALHGSGETAILELKNDSIRGIISEFNGGKLVTTGAGSNSLLVALLKPDANLGLVLIEMKKISKKIGIMGE